MSFDTTEASLLPDQRNTSGNFYGGVPAGGYVGQEPGATGAI
jgi:hypothetical protein